MNKNIYKFRQKVKKNSSLILTGGAVLGVGTTIFFTAKGQMLADDILRKRNEAIENPFDDRIYPPTVKEKTSLTWRCYIPAAISGGLTIFCIIGSQYISRKQIAGLAASVAFLTANRDQLETAIKEKYGEEALSEIKDKLKVRKPDSKAIKVYAEETGKGDLLCFEAYSGRWFRSNKEAVLESLRTLNDLFKNETYVSLNDLYKLLGIAETHFGFQYGWVPSVDYYDMEKGIKFNIWEEYDEKIGEDVLMFEPLGFDNYPMDGYYEY